MALVAYSDESDISDSEEIAFDNSKNMVNKNSNINSTSSINQNTIHDSISTSIEGNNIEEKSNTNLNASENIKNNDVNLKFDNLEDNLEESDVVNDVPTVKTWNITKDIKLSNIESSGKLHFNKESKVKPKLKLVLPALTEFDDDDDDDEENIEESVKKKMKPSATGTGLFAVLPKPRDTTLVPLTVSRKKTSAKQSKPKAKKVPSKSISSADVGHDSDEEISMKEGSNDFFSLSDSGSSHIPQTSIALPLVNLDPIPDDITQNRSPSYSQPCQQVILEKHEEQIPVDQYESQNVQTDYIPLSSGNITSDIDAKALRRLAGRRNAKEIPNIIDINADDALMSREEWVTRALCDEKPKKSFSKKREGNPTQQQKRKHQITYLAHQAQEREQDLQNTWGQNRFTKMQTQSKYGF